MTDRPEDHGVQDSMDGIATAASPGWRLVLARWQGCWYRAVALVALQIAAAVFTEKHTKSAEDYGQAL